MGEFKVPEGCELSVKEIPDNSMLVLTIPSDAGQDMLHSTAEAMRRIVNWAGRGITAIMLPRGMDMACLAEEQLARLGLARIKREAEHGDEEKKD